MAKGSFVLSSPGPQALEGTDSVITAPRCLFLSKSRKTGMCGCVDSKLCVEVLWGATGKSQGCRGI